MHSASSSLCLAALAVVSATSDAQEGEQVSSSRINRGNLSVTFRDNSQSPAVLSGIDSLFNTVDATDFDAFDPDAPGASAGLNLEHIISGHENGHNKFSPRHGAYTLHRSPDGRSVTLVRRAEDSPWKVGSTLKYVVQPPNYIDFEFLCTPDDASLFGQRGYAIFFFANYMNDVTDVALHFRGHASPDAEESWIAANAPQGHPDWNQGGNYRALAADDLRYEESQFRLNNWSYDWPRIARPFYYGRAGRDMTLILMFDRLYSERDQIRFSLYKFKLARHPRPAWDFQYVINHVVAGETFGFRGRLIWKKFISADDCQMEYHRWTESLEMDQARKRDECVAYLRRIGATAFLRNDDVVEVSANRTRIEDKDLRFLADFNRMTDLSLEETLISDAGVVHLRNLRNLEWLNLFRSGIGDQGLSELARSKSLQHLPLGETRVTDAGLVHLGQMKQLIYLGLRGNRVTDAGVKHLCELDNLTGLNLGHTKVSDEGIAHLTGMTHLQTLWLDQTNVSDEAVGSLSRLKTLRELHVGQTNITPAGRKRLSELLPKCRVVD